MIKNKGWVINKQHGRDIHQNPFYEAICPHGVGHHKGVHGCHEGKIKGISCCNDSPKEIWDKVTED